MGDIVNLKRVKKRAGRVTAAAAARESRIRSGRSKAAKENDRRAAERQADTLSGKRIEPD